MATKKQMRAQLAALRESLDDEVRAQCDARIAEQVVADPDYLSADTVFTYLSVGTEVDTRAIIRDAWGRGKAVAIPRVVPGTRTMQWYRMCDFERIEVSSFNIEEPVAEPSNLVDVPKAGDSDCAVALVPGYSFDAQGYRIGYGGGFYDVFLPGFGGTSLGLCRAVQFSQDPIPHDEHDVPVDRVIVG